MQKLFYLFLVVLSLISSSGAKTQAQENERLVIAATTTHVADLARIVTGGTAEILTIMGPGINPHQYRFTEKDSTTLREADMVLYSGLGFEGYVEITLEEFERQKPVFGVLNVVQEQGLALGSDEEPGLINSHAWHDPRNWILATQALADFLSHYDPARAEMYQANSQAYIAQLEILREWAVAAMQVVPEERRIVVSAHDAFSYFGYAFGWQVASVQGLSTADEAGVGDIQVIVDFVLTNRVPAVFTESSLPADTIEAVVASARDQDWDVKLGGELLADSMGAPETFTGTYIGMMHFNITLVVSAYGYGDALPPFPSSLPQPPDSET